MQTKHQDLSPNDTVVDFRPAYDRTAELEHTCLEESVLAGIIEDANATVAEKAPGISYVAALLPITTAFQLSSHRLIYACCLQLHKSGLKPSLQAVALRLAKDGLLQDAGGRTKLAQLMDRDAFAVPNLKQNAQMLAEAWQRRRLAEGLSNINKERDFDTALEKAVSEIERLQKMRVTSDSSCSGDTSNLDTARLTATVTSVTAILKQGFSDWEEQAHLDDLQAESGISKASFAHLVAAQRCKFDEVLPTDEKQLTQLISLKNHQLDFAKVVPHLASDLLHDAQVLNIDPIMLWQYLLPATLSLVGKKVDLDVNSHKVPAIAWTCSVGESGTGKSRAEGLILSPLKTWQSDEHHRFKAEWEEYKSASSKKGEESGEPAVPPVPERKYLFEVATIQAVMRRLSEQGENGSLWARDEIGGLFKSLGQFTSKGEGEGLECLLPMWDGSSAPVDRVQHEDSYYLASSRLSLAGGIQPGVFRKIFQDPDDAQGLQARFLFALPKVQPAKRVKGACKLAEKLPLFYRWIDTQFAAGTIKLSSAADARYDAVYEQIGQQAEAAETPAIRAWMRKLPGQLLRIALALHIIECYHEPGRSRHEIQLDTLNRAVDLCRYYRSTFAVVQQSVSDSDAISSILLQIWDRAAMTPGGLAVRDAYRSVKAIGRRAKEAGRQVAAYTIDLYYQLQKSGLGVVQQTGRMVKFIVGQVAPITPTTSDATEAVTVVTPAQVQTGQGFLVSPSIEVSQVTQQVHSASNDTDVQDSVAYVNGEHTLGDSDLSKIAKDSQFQQYSSSPASNSETAISSAVEQTAVTSKLQLVQNPVAVSNTVPSSDVRVPSEQVQTLPGTQELANQILLCESWVAAANICQCDGAKLKAAVELMKDDAVHHLTILMVQHLLRYDSEQLATELTALWTWLLWLPETLKEQILGVLQFTVTQINSDAPVGLNDVPLTVKIESCRLVECRTENYGRSRQSTDFYFQAPGGAILKSSEGWFEVIPLG